MKHIITLFFILLTIGLFAQVANEETLDIGHSCEKAIELSFEDQDFLNPEVLSVLEFAPKTSSLENFNRELNLTWYTFKSPSDILVGFEIIPSDIGDNVDFLLFDASMRKYCTMIQKPTTIPLRRNLSKDECHERVGTGLTVGNTRTSYQQPVMAHKNQRFVLVVNNVYATGGHRIRLKTFAPSTIKGRITSKELDHVSDANIFWVNQTIDQVVSTTKTDSLGNFTINAIVDETDYSGVDYELIVSHPSYQLEDTVLREDARTSTIDLALTRLKKDEVMVTYDSHIYFKPNSSDKISEESRPRLESLVKEMKFAPKIKVQLEGHSNGLYPSTEVDNKLSYERAQSVKNYLVNKGIEQHRIFVKSFGSEKQLFPKAKDAQEESRNRRVEIRYIDF